MGIDVPARGQVRQQRSAFGAQLLRAQQHLDVRPLRLMEFDLIQTWLAGLEQAAELTIVGCVLPEVTERHSPLGPDSFPVLIGSRVGPISVPHAFGPFEVRILQGILAMAGGRTNIGATAAALKEVRAFWDTEVEQYSTIPWIENLPEADVNLIVQEQGRKLLLDAVTMCFHVLLSHLLSLLACLSASGF